MKNTVKTSRANYPTHKNRQFPTDSTITQKHTISHKNKQINTKSNNFPQKHTISHKNKQFPTKTYNKIQQKHTTKSNKIQKHTKKHNYGNTLQQFLY